MGIFALLLLTLLAHPLFSAPAHQGLSSARTNNQEIKPTSLEAEMARLIHQIEAKGGVVTSGRVWRREDQRGWRRAALADHTLDTLIAKGW